MHRTITSVFAFLVLFSGTSQGNFIQFHDLLQLHQGGYPGVAPAEVGLWVFENGERQANDYFVQTSIPPDVGLVSMDGSYIRPFSGGTRNLLDLQWDTSSGIRHDWSYTPVSSINGDGEVNVTTNIAWYYSATTAVNYTLTAFWDVNPGGFGPNDQLVIPAGWTAMNGGYGFTESGVLTPDDGIQEMAARMIQRGGPASTGSFALTIAAVPEPSTWWLCAIPMVWFCLKQHSQKRNQSKLAIPKTRV